MDTPILGQQPGPLAKLEKLTADSVGAQESIPATRDIVTPWIETLSKDNCIRQIGIVGDLANRMGGESMNFLQSTHLSYKNAQSGYSFAKSAELLCSALLKPKESFATSSLLRYIGEMREIAQEAHREATSTAQSFRDNRQGFNTITGTIPGAIQSVRTKKAQIESKKAEAEEQAKSWELRARQLASKPAWHPSRLFGSHRRAGSKAEAFQAEAEDRKTEIQRYGEAVDYLEPAIEQLKTLMAYIDSFAGYWLEMDSILEDMHERVDELRNDELLQTKVEAMQNDWRKMASGYLTYKKTVAKLQDLRPATRSAPQISGR